MDLTVAPAKLDILKMAIVVLLLQVSEKKKKRTRKLNVLGLKTIKTSHVLSLSVSQHFSHASPDFNTATLLLNSTLSFLLQYGQRTISKANTYTDLVLRVLIISIAECHR